MMIKNYPNLAGKNLSEQAKAVNSYGKYLHSIKFEVSQAQQATVISRYEQVQHDAALIFKATQKQQRMEIKK